MKDISAVKDVLSVERALSGDQRAFWTFPERRHRVQTQICLTPSGVWALTC